MNVICNLGERYSGDAVPIGIIAPYTGTYTFDIEILGSHTTIATAFTAGDDIEFQNGLMQNAVIRFRIKLPTASLDDGINYITTPNGEILFEYKNVL